MQSDEKYVWSLCGERYAFHPYAMSAVKNVHAKKQRQLKNKNKKTFKKKNTERKAAVRVEWVELKKKQIKNEIWHNNLTAHKFNIYAVNKMNGILFAFLVDVGSHLRDISSLPTIQTKQLFLQNTTRHG